VGEQAMALKFSVEGWITAVSAVLMLAVLINALSALA
jgi:hypothetical protein